MDQVHVIRHKVLIEGLSIRRVAREMRISRVTVRKYLNLSQPTRVEKAPRPKPVQDKVASRIDQLLDQWRHRITAKQRVTASRIHRQLLDEGFTVGITTVRDYLREKHRQAAEVFIPLVYRPGELAQVDFFEVRVEEAGVVRKALKFFMNGAQQWLPLTWRSVNG